MAVKTIGILPCETLFIIFSYLDHDDLFSCTLVSKSWSTMARDPSLWRNFHVVKKTINMSTLEIRKWTSIPRLSKVENLEVYGSLNHKEFANFAVYNDNYLSRSWPSYRNCVIIEDEHFQVLCQTSSIKNLSISFCEIDYSDSFVNLSRYLFKVFLERQYIHFIVDVCQNCIFLTAL